MRRDARETVFKIIFAKSFNDCSNVDEIMDFVFSETTLKAEDKTFAKELLGKIEENKEYILDTLQSLTNEYKLDRLFVADKCAIMIGIAEIKFFDSVPNVVAIDEAVSLSKKYSTETSSGFVNGVLAKFKTLTEETNE